MKNKWIIVGLSLVLFFMPLLWEKSISNTAKRVVLNEVCSNNGQIIRDGIHDGSDYIELYNSSEEAVDLSGWYLSDDELSPQKYQLPSCIIEPGSYVVFYANGQNSDSNLPFKISASGEKIFLSDSEGNLVDSVAVPVLGLNETYSRIQDGDEQWDVKSPTISKSNSLGKKIAEKKLSSPQFSAKTGFYDKEFLLTLQAEKGQTIYYTLDGSIPDETSQIYQEPILIQNRSNEPNQYISTRNVVKNWKEYQPMEEPVDKATIVRAVAIDKEGFTSEVVTETYFVELEKYESMAVISLSADPNALFGEEGIFVTGTEYDYWYENGAEGESPIPNFYRRGKSWEVEASMQFLSKGILLSDQSVGIRTQGNSGRSQALKRLSLFSRAEYSGSNYFDESILGKKNVHALMINEFVSNTALPRLVSDRDVAIQTSRTEEVAVFINGEYWYTRYMLEKYNEDYLSSTYDVEQDNLLMMKNNQVEIGDAENESLFRGLQAMASDQGLTADEKYEKLSEVIDMQSFIDFFSINIYLCNMNMNEVENYMLWRTIKPEKSEYGDTKWRWMIYDVEPLESLRLEYYEVDERAKINTFNHPQDWTGYILDENSIFQGLLECEKFRKQFVLSFLDIANVNFSKENVEPLLEQYGLDMTWLENFFLNRFEYIVEDLAEELSLTGTLETLSLQVNDTEGGTILLNTTCPDLSDGSWEGAYYTDFPVNVTAVPSKGYRFVGWKGSVESCEETIEIAIDAGGTNLCAVFEKK